MNLSATVPTRYSPEQYKSLEIWYDYLENTYPILRNLPVQDTAEESTCFAVFIDYRKHPYMEYIFRNIMHFLGSGWGLQVFVWPENRQFVENIIQNFKYVSLVEMENNHDSEDISDTTMRSVEFWNKVKGEKQLFFDLDSLLCRSGIDEFMQYDYIGAPWVESHAISPVCQFGSGGLSIRSKKAMIDICSSTNTRSQLIAREDLFYSINMHLESDKYCLPSVETARRFVVEGVYHPKPLGLHKPWLCLPPEQLNELIGSIDYT